MISLLTNSPWSIFVINILDIAIIAFAVYKILEIMRGTRAMPLAKGVGVLLVFSVLSDVLGLSTVNWVLVQLQTMFIVAIPVVFAPELRRALEQLGTGGIFARSRHLSDNDLVAHQVQQICGCMTAASASRTGVRLTLKYSAISVSDIFSPGLSCITVIQCCIVSSMSAFVSVSFPAYG